MTCFGLCRKNRKESAKITQKNVHKMVVPLLWHVFCYYLWGFYIYDGKRQKKPVLASKKWYWPANGKQSTSLLVEIHNSCGIKVKYIKNFFLISKNIAFHQLTLKAFPLFRDAIANSSHLSCVVSGRRQMISGKTKKTTF